MYNYAYTLLLNRTVSQLGTPLRLVDSGFSMLSLPAYTLGPIDTALFADCTDLVQRQQRAEAYLPLILTPEYAKYAFTFDTRNTYVNKTTTLLNMCTDPIPVPFTPERVERITAAIRTFPGLFALPAYAADMELFRTSYYGTSDACQALGAALLAYVYQLEQLRTS